MVCASHENSFSNTIIMKKKDEFLVLMSWCVCVWKFFSVRFVSHWNWTYYEIVTVKWYRWLLFLWWAELHCLRLIFSFFFSFNWTLWSALDSNQLICFTNNVRLSIGNENVYFLWFFFREIMKFQLWIIIIQRIPEL